MGVEALHRHVGPGPGFATQVIEQTAWRAVKVVGVQVRAGHRLGRVGDPGGPKGQRADGVASAVTGGGRQRRPCAKLIEHRISPSGQRQAAAALHDVMSGTQQPPQSRRIDEPHPGQDDHEIRGVLREGLDDTGRLRRRGEVQLAVDVQQAAVREMFDFDPEVGDEVAAQSAVPSCWADMAASSLPRARCSIWRTRSPLRPS